MRWNVKLRNGAVLTVCGDDELQKVKDHLAPWRDDTESPFRIMDYEEQKVHAARGLKIQLDDCEAEKIFADNDAKLDAIFDKPPTERTKEDEIFMKAMLKRRK